MQLFPCFFTQIVEEIVEVPVEVRVPYPVHVNVDQIVHVPHEVERFVYHDGPIEVPNIVNEKGINVGVDLGVDVGVGLLSKFKKPLKKKFF